MEQHLLFPSETWGGVGGIRTQAHAPFRTDLIEYEYDHVFAGSYDGDISLNTEEASEIRWISFADLKDELLHTPEKFSSWFLICAPRVMQIIQDGN